MKHTKKYRRRLIAVITLILLILLSLWMFIKASEDEAPKQECYKPYRGNVLGVAGDFCVFTCGNADLSEVTADVAVGGDFTAGSFGNYKTKWDFYEKNDLKFVNLNSYIRGKYNGGTYAWVANKSKENLTCSNGEIKGIYDEENNNGKANLYIYTGDEKNQIGEASSNQCNINGQCYEDTPCSDNLCDKQYKSYNVIGVDYEFIDFEKEFENLSKVSETLMNIGEQIEVECVPDENNGKIFTYEFPENQNTVLITVNPENFFNTDSYDTFNIEGMNSSKKIIINVDCSSLTECPVTPRIQVNGSSEDWNCLAENILFNFYHPQSNKIEQIEAKEIIGTILAPNLEVYINGNLDGSVLSRKVRTTNAIYGINSNIGWDDINGKSKEETTSVYVEKIWNDGDEESKRPDSVKFKLLADEEEKGTVTLTKDGQIVKIEDKEQQDENGEKKTAKSISYSTSGNKSIASASEAGGSIDYYIELDITGITDWWKFSSQDFTCKITHEDGTTEEKTICASNICGWSGFNAENKITIKEGETATITVVTCSICGQGSTCYITEISACKNTCGKTFGYQQGNWITFKIGDTQPTETPSITITNGNSTTTPDPTEPDSGKDKGETEGETTPGGGETEGSGSETNPPEGQGGQSGETTKPEETEKPKEEEKLKEWSCKIIELPKYKETSDDDEEKQEIKYTIEEVEVNDNYVSKIEEIKDDEESDNDKDEYAAKYRITNTLLTDIEGEKIWKDSDNNDGYRPETIQVTLYKKVKEDDATEKEEKVEQEGVDNPKTVTKGDNEDNSWSYKFSKVKKYDEDKKEIEYFVKEEPLDDKVKDKYTTSYGEGEDKFKITNKHELETTEFEVTKVWEDNEDQDGKRPESVEVTLKADKDDVKIENATVTLNEANNWKHKFTGLQKYKNGEEITYTVDEKEVKEYEKSIKGNTITNTHTPSKIDIEGQKTWNDNDDQDGKRPEQVVVKLFANGEEVKEQQKTVTSENDWKYKFEGLDEYANGKKIEYTIKEDNVDDYQTKIDGYNITNTHEPEKIDIPVTKIWDDKDNQDGIRPESITVRVLANGNKVEEQTITEKEDWKYEFKDLPKYEKGKEIIYTIEEDSINKYTTKIDKYNITNTHIPETIEITVTKKWEDSNNQDGKRPDSIVVRLLADGQQVEEKKVTVTEAEKWQYKFKDLPKYNAGKEIVYTVEEDSIKDYETNINKYDITNTHIPEKIDIKGTKTWEDNNNQDGKRPEKITVRLFANDEEQAHKDITAENKWEYEFKDLPKYKDGEEIDYTIKEDTVKDYVTTIDGYNITNAHTPEKIKIKGTKKWKDEDDQDGKRPKEINVKLFADGVEIASKTVTENEEWKYEFTDLDKYKDGEEITYTIDEDSVQDYTKKIDGYNLTNTHKPEVIDIKGKKIWEDADNQDGIRPDSITVKLLANGEEVPGKRQNVTKDTNWEYNFKSVPKYNKGKEINYTVEEEPVKGYKTTIEDKNITNTHEIETVEVVGTKTWKDGENQDGIRPDSVTIRLLADGKEVKNQVKEVNATNNWQYTFKDLPKYKAGKQIEYSVKEDEVTGYKAKIEGYNITNTHEIETVEVVGTKTWKDGENQDGIRPQSITVKLLANGEEKDSVTVTSENKWKYEFKDLPKYKDGKEIVYTVDEEDVPEYKKSIKGYNITNEHEPEKISIEGKKTWADLNNQDGIRPQSITVKLLADGKVVQTKKVTESDNWTYKFEKLDKYKKGTEIVYTIDEDEVEDYEKEIHGYNITNRHGVVAGEEVIDVDVTKKWEDKGYEELRPGKVTVNLLANGEIVRTKDITAEDKWKCTFKQLEMFDEEGNEIEYSVEEEAIAGYETRIEGFEIINTYIPPVADDKIVIKINKYEKGTTKKLKDAKFELVIKKEAGKDKDNKKKYKEVLKETNTTNSIGQIVLKDLDLEEGTYVLELNEKEAPKGYKKSDDSIKIEFTVKEKDGKKVIELKDKNKNVQVEKTTMTIKVENAKEQKKDNTTSKGKLPQTGPGNMIIAGIVIVGFLAVGAIGIFKYREVKF